VTAAVVIGLGNSFRRDDGVGPAVVAAVDAMGLPGVRMACAAEMTDLLDVWDSAALAVVVDAAVGQDPGSVLRCELADLTDEKPLSSHGFSLTQTYDLARALGRAPSRLVVVSVGVADTGHGVGLSPAVQAALPEAARVVRRAVEQAQEPGHQQP
jgi:hydrogenase maturation protease